MRSLCYGELQALCEEFRPLIVGERLKGCSALTQRTVILHFEKHSLLIALESPFMRLHLTTKKGEPSPLAKRLEELLKGARLRDLSLGEDRVVTLDLQPLKLTIALIPARPNLTLCRTDAPLFSLYPDRPPMMGALRSHAPVATTSQQIEEEADLLLREAQERELNKRRSRLVEELKVAQGWEKLLHTADLLKANYHRLQRGMSEIQVEDFESGESRTIPLEAQLTPQENLAKAFKRARKAKAAVAHLTKRIAELQPKRKSLMPRSSEEREQRRLYLTFTSSTGLKILVGRSSKGNDYLTFRVAKGNDLWLHVRDLSGAHVVVQGPRNQPVDEKTIKEAMQLALHYSKAKGGEGYVALTKRKFVHKRPRARAGEVHLSEEKSYFVREDQELIASLKSRGSDNQHRAPSQSRES